MVEDFQYELIDGSVSHITSKWIFERIPHIFNNDFELYLQWKQKLSELINVDSSAIVFTGSSSCGFSLNPYKNYKAYDEESDIDLALISSYHFDVSWHTLRNLGTKYYRLPARQKTSVDDHVSRLIYYGTIATDKIIGILPFGKEWMNALNEMGQTHPLETRVVNIRIYKDFESLRDYQTKNIEKLRHKLIEES